MELIRTIFSVFVFHRSSPTFKCFAADIVEGKDDNRRLRYVGILVRMLGPCVFAQSLRYIV